MDIYLLRHARARVFDGDFYRAGLSPESIEAATALARSGAIPRPDLLISSPFRRARETAAAFAAQFCLEVEIDDAFAEWKLRTLNLDEEAHSREERSGFDAPAAPVAGGESLAQMNHRVLGAVEGISRREAGVVLVATHGTVIHLVCARLAGRTPAIEALHRTAFLDYAVLESTTSGLRLIRDIVRDAE